MSDTISAWGDRRVHQVPKGPSGYWRNNDVKPHADERTGPADRRAVRQGGEMIHEKGIEIARALDFEGVVGFLSDLMDDVRNGHTFNAKEQAEILINLACEPLRRGRPIRATQPTSEGEERVVVAEGTWDEYGTQVVDADRIPLVDIQPIVDGTAKFDGHLVRVVVEVIP